MIGALKGYRLKLCLPENVLAPGADGWNGPENWSKRTPKGEYA